MFKTQNDFSLHIENLKITHEFDTYIETLTYFYENETDHEMVDIAKMLNNKIVSSIQVEAEKRGLLKESDINRLM